MICCAKDFFAHSFSIPLIRCGSRETITLGWSKRTGIPWIVRQSIVGPTQTDEQPFTQRKNSEQTCKFRKIYLLTVGQ